MGSKRRRQDHYDVLGVSHEAPDEVIRAAYRALAAKYHPDRNPGDAKAELKLKKLNAAFEVLGNPEKRKQYDELTRSPEADDVSGRVRT
jgi:curved DNA-binding protein CbpA